MPVIVEVKAQTDRAEQIREILVGSNARFVGTDHQIDTYFDSPHGRLKLREGSIENHLIYYDRPNQTESKTSKVLLYRPNPEPIPEIGPRTELKALLRAAMGQKLEVDKMREIYFIDNVKFHIDEVKLLGQFVEIEAIDEDGSRTEAILRKQCEEYVKLLQIKPNDLIGCSYSDLVAAKTT